MIKQKKFLLTLFFGTFLMFVFLLNFGQTYFAEDTNAKLKKITKTISDQKKKMAIKQKKHLLDKVNSSNVSANKWDELVTQEANKIQSKEDSNAQKKQTPGASNETRTPPNPRNLYEQTQHQTHTTTTRQKETRLKRSDFKKKKVHTIEY